MYKEALKDSFNDLKKNLILYIPGILGFLLLVLFSSILSYFFFVDSSLYTKQIQGLSNDEVLEVTKNFILENWESALVNILGLLLLTFIVKIFTYAIELGMMGGIINKIKLKFKPSLRTGFAKFINLGSLILFTGLIILVPFILLLLLAFILKPTGLIAAVLSAILVLLYLVFFVLTVFYLQFSVQELYISNSRPITAMKNSYRFTRKNLSASIAVFIITVAVLLISNILIQLLTLIKPNTAIIIFTIGFISFLISKTAFLLVDLFKFRILKQLSNKRQKS